ncbi:PD-(D/E)XK nuclease family protein [Paenibacillus woosongensis]|uniref:PD-(D/E)XK nuclease family protein n=1 Tax=Paenibacillus woosongensis TaxID=307580 RepID=A0AA95I9Z8_9BACL|nr:PD-(D/E)XK nuclease family protein [Paenibacillus woosongensis]WHX50074.1 PD-(D/E)XK nuclease family protein [Paenibacillus woosongensis]
MKSVFSRLFQVLNSSSGQPHEDFLTEVFAELLCDQETMIDFLGKVLEIPVQEAEHSSITTQVTFPALPHHQMDSRPDMVIRFYEGQKPYVLFIESKLGSPEGTDQLSRYADHLGVLTNQGTKCYLIYLTQYSDEKDASLVLANHNNIVFRQLRWFQIFKWMKQLESKNIYASKVLDYMEEIGLKDNRQFTPVDVYAIQNMNRLQRMMDECMDGVVDGVMTKHFGKAIQQSNRHTQLKYMERYVKASEQEGRATEVVVGFYLTDDDYPIVSVAYEFCEGRCPNFPKVVAAMQNFIATHSGWETFDLNTDAEWQGISCDRSLVDFLHYEDHINEIQKFFLEKLNELHDIKVKNPDLHWK